MNPIPYFHIGGVKMKAGIAEFIFKGNTKDIESKASGLGKTIKSLAAAGGKALMGLATTSATILTTITKYAVKSQGEIEQQIGGTQAVFGKYAKTVQKRATAAYKKMGVSANDYMQYMNKMGSLMKGSGMKTKQAMDLSSKAMQRAADVASVMGISVDEAMRAITGAAKGNFTMMDNLGVAMNATSLEAYAVSKGIKTAYKDMKQATKVQLAMEMFLEKSKHAAGNYAKENKTLAGSLNTLKAATQNLLSGTGTVDQFLTELENFGTIVLDKIIEIFPKVADSVIKIIDGLLPVVAEKLPGLIETLAPILINGITTLTLKLIEILPELTTMIADMLPTLIPMIIDAILLIIPELVKQWPVFAKAGIQLIKGLAKGLWQGIKNIFTKIGEWVVALTDKFIDKVSEWINIGVEWIKGLWEGIKSVKQWIIDKIGGWADSIVDKVKDFFGISSPSKEFEIIGRFNVLGLEKGMEEEGLKLQDDFNEMFSLSPSLYGTSNTHLSPQVNVVNNINMKQDALGQMVNDIKTFSGGAKNDYSYGMGV